MRSAMKRFAAVIVISAAALLLGACCHGGKHHGRGMGGPRGGSAIYWCGSAVDGPCSGISITRGTCPDGSPMNAGHVIRVEGTVALVCVCGAECDCKIDSKDHTKCGCGKSVRKIDLAGTGIYFCNCKGSCGCNTLSDQPGTCKCGMPLHQSK